MQFDAVKRALHLWTYRQPTLEFIEVATLRWAALNESIALKATEEAAREDGSETAAQNIFQQIEGLRERTRLFPLLSTAEVAAVCAPSFVYFAVIPSLSLMGCLFIAATSTELRKFERRKAIAAFVGLVYLPLGATRGELCLVRVLASGFSFVKNLLAERGDGRREHESEQEHGEGDQGMYDLYYCYTVVYYCLECSYC